MANKRHAIRAIDWDNQLRVGTCCIVQMGRGLRASVVPFTIPNEGRNGNPFRVRFPIDPEHVHTSQDFWLCICFLGDIAQVVVVHLNLKTFHRIHIQALP